MKSAQFGTWEDAVCWLRHQPDGRQLVLDAFYDDPLIEAAERYFNSSEWTEIVRILDGKRGRALDVGAGRGIASYAMARMGFSVTALEPDPSAIVGAAAIRELSKESKLPIEVVGEFSERLPFADASFDLVFGRAVLHHTLNLETACREMYRVLKPGGTLIAAREHVISRQQDLPIFLQRHPLHHLYGGENAFLLKRYVGALRGANFHRIQTLSPLTSPINLYPYTIAGVRDELVSRLSRKLPLGAAWRTLLRSDSVIRLLLFVASLLDNRPGRLYTFVAHRAMT